MALRRGPSDGHDADVGVIGGKKLQVARIVGEYQPAAESDRCGDNQGVDRRAAVPSRDRQEVAGDPCYPDAGRHHPGESASKYKVDCLISSRAPVELDEDG